MPTNKSHVQAVLDLLLIEFRRTATPSLPEPEISIGTEKSKRLLVAIAWAADYGLYGYIHPLTMAVDAMCESLGLKRIADIGKHNEDDIHEAIWRHGSAIPDITVDSAARKIFRVVGESPQMLAHASEKTILKAVHRAYLGLPIPTALALQHLGKSYLPLPSQEACVMCAYSGVVPWEDGLFSASWFRNEVRKSLQEHPREVFFALELMGKHCPQMCHRCGCLHACRCLNEGWI